MIPYYKQKAPRWFSWCLLPEGEFAEERLLLLSGCLDHVHVQAVTPLGKLDHAVLSGKERVIGSHADVVAGVILGAALPHDDVAGAHRLAAINLHTQPLRVAVAAVAGAAQSFLVGE